MKTVLNLNGNDSKENQIKLCLALRVNSEFSYKRPYTVALGKSISVKGEGFQI